MNIILYGAGGHGKVVLQVIKKAKQHVVTGLIDVQRRGTVLGVPILGGEEVLPALTNVRGVVVGIGDNRVRAEKAKMFLALKLDLVTAIDPQAMVAEDVKIGAGSVVMPGAIINSGARIGRNVIINTGAIIEHDCVIGDHVHISPGVRLAGTVTVNEMAHIGIGAVVIENITIGTGTMIGAGAVVVDSIQDHVLAVGVPARVIKEIA
jgi:sugar O-acyltransferase (sialic acid O-acetyltransferase NeuD family)